MTIDPIVRKYCGSVFNSDSDRALCMRGSMAGFALTTALSRISKEKQIEILAPEVYQEQQQTSFSQCMFNTFFSGALCSVRSDVDVSDVDPRIGTCNKEDGHSLGYRPACWYSN